MIIRVLIADDHPLVRQGLRAALAALPEVETSPRPPPDRPPSARPSCTSPTWSSWTCRCPT